MLLSGDTPVVGPNSVAQLRAFLDQPEPPLPEPSEVDVMITRLALATAQPKLSSDEAKERLKAYWIALRDLPLCDLRAAYVKLIQTHTFLPTPAQVRTVVLQSGATRLHVQSRARQLIWHHEQHWTPPVEMVPQGELKALLSSVKIGIQTFEDEGEA